MKYNILLYLIHSFGEYCESSNSIKCEMIEPENN